MRYVAMLCLLGLAATLSPVQAEDAVPLYRDEIVELVSGKTAECRKEKDDSLCYNYFTADGVMKQRMHDDGEEKEGVWFIDDEERLCILWTGKIKPLCFVVYEQADGSYNLLRYDNHITTILSLEDGNPRGL
jgi:hypothetical protein